MLKKLKKNLFSFAVMQDDVIINMLYTKYSTL